MTELEFIETYAPAIGHDFIRGTPLEVAAAKINLAREMYYARADFVQGLTDVAANWIDSAAAMTPMKALFTQEEARKRYEMARQCWSEIFAMKAGLKK